MVDSNAHKIAQYIIAFSHEQGDPISNLKLQKLLYYVQAWALALHDEPIFDEQLEAWLHGPVVPSVYSDYKGWAWQPINANITLEEAELPEAVKAHVNEVLEVYGPLTAPQLELLTHQEDPWIKARRGLPKDVASNSVISHEDMRAFYKRLAKEDADQAK
jgi:uncharacterized phage-associated protein